MASETAIQKSEPQTIDVNTTDERRSTWTYRPNADIFDTTDELVLIADMPGATRDSIDVSLESGILTLQAAVAPRTHDGARELAREYGVGNFHRRFEINERIDEDAINAEYRDGSLTVRLPKANESRSRRVPITA